MRRPVSRTLFSTRSPPSAGPTTDTADGARAERCVDDRTDLERRLGQVVEGARERTGLDEGDDGDRGHEGRTVSRYPPGMARPRPLAALRALLAESSRRGRAASWALALTAATAAAALLYAFFPKR